MVWSQGEIVIPAEPATLKAPRVTSRRIAALSVAPTSNPIVVRRRLFDVVHERQGTDIFVASFSAFQNNNDELISDCLWWNG